MEKTGQCWCGNNRLSPFSQGYALCKNCESLVVVEVDKQESMKAFDDESSFL